MGRTLVFRDICEPFAGPAFVGGVRRFFTRSHDSRPVSCLVFDADDDSQVKDGRWAWTEMPSVEEDNPGELVPDVYGLLRSRWNVNPNP